MLVIYVTFMAVSTRSQIGKECNAVGLHQKRIRIPKLSHLVLRPRDRHQLDFHDLTTRLKCAISFWYLNTPYVYCRGE